MLDRTQIEAILPHRDPFLFLDSVSELIPGEYVVAEKYLEPTLDVFRGHFPGHPVFPGVLQLEGIAQAGAVAILSQPGAQGKIILFGRADEVKFRREVSPGETLRFEMRITRTRGTIGRGEGKAFVGSELACSAVLTFAIAEP
jgi:3-hydroxyacyl-[acyl-carrier-protein] dehydratase